MLCLAAFFIIGIPLPLVYFRQFGKDETVRSFLKRAPAPHWRDRAVKEKDARFGRIGRTQRLP